MNASQIHVLLNHFPIIGLPIAAALLFFALLFNNQSLYRTTYWLVIVLALITIPVYLSGESSHEVVEHISGMSHQQIHEHDKWAKFGLTGMLILGVLSAAALFLGAIKRNWQVIGVVLLLFYIGVSGLLAYVGHQGGLIMHPEINSNYVVPAEPDHDH